MLPLENILFAPIEEKRETTPDEVPQIEDESAALVEPEPEPVEVYPEKPRDENSDFVPNTNLTDEEIAQLILDEEEVLNEKGVLGVNFKKLRPRAPLLKESKVFQELQQEASIDPVAQEKEQLLKSTFLQKPDRPVPKPRTKSQSEEPEVEPYRVVIKKQPKKSVTERLLAKGLIDASRVSSPQPSNQASEVTEPAPAPEPTAETPTRDTSASAPLGTWSLTSSIDDPDQPADMESPDPMSPISEAAEEATSFPFDAPPDVELEPTSEANYQDAETTIPQAEPEAPPRPCEELAPASFLVVRKKTRLCRRGRYARRCLRGALESLRCARPGKPRLLRRGRYFERIVRGLAGGEPPKQQQQQVGSEESLLRLLMLASLACSLRDTYDQEILHRGSSRRNSRRMSQCRRESCAELSPCEAAGLLGLRRKNSDGLTSLRSRCAEGRRRLSVMGMMVADKVSTAMRTDLARGLAYAFVPCASALAFFMFNYAKRLNSAAANE